MKAKTYPASSTVVQSTVPWRWLTSIPSASAEPADSLAAIYVLPVGNCVGEILHYRRSACSHRMPVITSWYEHQRTGASCSRASAGGVGGVHNLVRGIRLRSV